MSLSFSRSDITQTAQAERGTMCVLPLGKGKRQNKLALGDVDGVVRVVGCKRDERNVVFKLECGNGAPITSLSCGVAAPQVDKLFASAGNTIRGINRKGKEFFKFTTNLQDVIKALHVDNYNIYAASEYVANMYVNCADSHFFMSNDRILDVVIAPVILPDEKNPILACADRFIRVVQGSDLYYEAAVNGVPTTLCRCVENEKKVRSIHWLPYDRVGVVNADP